MPLLYSHTFYKYKFRPKYTPNNFLDTDFNPNILSNKKSLFFPYIYVMFLPKKFPN